jgi:hypothetical protein
MMELEGLFESGITQWRPDGEAIYSAESRCMPLCATFGSSTGEPTRRAIVGDKNDAIEVKTNPESGKLN